jgi:pumilio RNA-binding family
VIQFILESGLPEDRSRLLGQLSGRIFELSRHKFASNVCEKALLIAGPDVRQRLIRELVDDGPGGESKLVALMEDQFGSA